jgi:hypothetical protein
MNDDDGNGRFATMALAGFLSPAHTQTEFVFEKQQLSQQSAWVYTLQRCFVHCKAPSSKGKKAFS